MARSLSLSIVCAVTAALGMVSAPSSRAAEFHLQEATIDDIQQAILAHNLTTVQVVELYLKRIKAYNGTCVKQPKGILGPIEPIANAGQLNALQTLNLRPATRKKWGFDDRKARSLTDKADASPTMPDALEVAAAQDAEFKKTGKLVGPLQGVVLAFKDQYDTFDMRTTGGADVPYANDRPPDDATFIKRLRDAGAIILAKANLVEYAGGTSPRSSYGGVFCNAYDTTRSPSGSSSGSGSSVAANLVTCAIAEETGSSIRGPARAGNSVGISPTQELVSRDGMIGLGINTRVGPICRNVADAAKILDAYAGYDPKDALTVFSIGRKPAQPYASFAHTKSLSGLRIGVVREYMDKSKFTKTDEQTIDLVERATSDLAKLGATVVDPGAGKALFTDCMKQYVPQLDNKLFTKRFPDQFPVDAQGKPVGDHIGKLVDMTVNPASVPEVTLRDLGQAQAVGESKFQMNLYLAQRGDANIHSNTDLLNKSTFYDDPHFTDRKQQRVSMEKPVEVNMAERMQRRFAVQEMVLQCMAEQHLDALVYPTTNLPPAVLGQPDEPPVNGRGGAWSFLGQQGFPAITVPAGFTTEVYDRVRDPSAPPPAPIPEGVFAEGGREPTKLIGPVKAVLPVGMDIVGRPFDEPTLLRIASAYEAATKHRTPPKGFPPLKGEP
jgi:Asp-tRNA(Asn)/Glu-tRNA(Gln) amidotransferase A subunit family amidase